jgi:hypothetical protein
MIRAKSVLPVLLAVGLCLFSVAAFAANLFVTGENNGNVYKVTSGGSPSLFTNLGSSVNAFDVAFDGSGNLFVTGENNGNIYKVTSGGSPSLFASLGSSVNASGLAFAPNPVPEPSSVVLFGFAAIGFAVIARRRIQQQAD